MAENAGRIEYDFVADTTGVLKAESVVDKSTTNMANDFKKVDKAAATTSTQMTKAAAGVKKGVQANLGQAGIQVQQFVGQLQGGQSAMVALAQQSADLGIVLGAPLIGVFVSLAAVLAGTLAPAIFGSVSNIEKLQKAIENTKAIMTLGKNGIIEYTDEMKRLETASENLAKIKIALAITENTKALKDSRKEFTAMRADLFGFQEDSSEAAKRLTGMTDKTGDVLKLASSLQAFSNAVTDESKLKALESVEQTILKMRNANGEFPTKDLTEFAQKFFALSDATRQAIANSQALKKSNEDLNTSTSNTGESFNQLRIGLKEQTIALQDGERAAFKYSLLMSGEYTAAQINAALKIYDTNAALVEQKKASEESARAIKSVNAELDAFFDKESKQSAAKDERDRGQAENFAQGIIDRGMSEPERFAVELEKLTELRREGLLSQQLYDQAIVASVKNRSEQMEKANQQNLQSQRLFTDSQGQLLGSLGNLFGSYADNMEVQDRESFEKKKKFQTAQALINTAMAISNALAAAPPPISFALAAASGAMGAIQVAAIQGQQYSGGRQYGGPVSNGMYRVNETGVPEVYSHGGKDYLMNTKNANIKPLEQGGGGGGMTVNVSNNTPYEVYVTQDQAANIANVQIGREAGKMAKGQGSMFKAVRSSTNAKGNARN